MVNVNFDTGAILPSMPLLKSNDVPGNMQKNFSMTDLIDLDGMGEDVGSNIDAAHYMTMFPHMHDLSYGGSSMHGHYRSMDGMTGSAGPNPAALTNILRSNDTNRHN